MRGRWAGGLALAAAGAAILLLAFWLRNPLIPYSGNTSGASSFSADSAREAEALARRAKAIQSLGSEVVRVQRQLAAHVAAAVNAPAEPDGAFEYLKELDAGRGVGIILVERGRPLAWTGQFRNPPISTGTGTSVSFSPFYTTLQVATARGDRQAIAAAVVHAELPADHIVAGIDEGIAEKKLVESFRFGPLSDSASGTVIRGAGGHPLMRVDADPLSTETVRFGERATARVIGAIVLGIAIAVLVMMAWFDRRALAPRIATIMIALAALAAVPWNNFSNYTRFFDPAYFYSALAGPLTASSGVFAIFASLLLLGVIALIRARRAPPNRIIAGVAGTALIAAGVVLTELAAGGIVLPLWGATASLWVMWQVPLFLLLFAFWLAGLWLIRLAAGRAPVVHLRGAAIVACICGALATFVVWTNTTEQRLQLAMRDVAGLQRTDGDVSQLLTRFASQLSVFDQPGTRANLLKRYATSDIAAADLQVSLSTWGAGGTLLSRLDLAPLEFDSLAVRAVIRESVDSGQAVISQVLGPTGRQVIMAVPHRDGGVTSVIASPRTRLIAQNPYTALLGFEQPDKTDPPYTLILADVVPGTDTQAGAMTWRRIGTEWHGDEIIATSAGPVRAHVEVDLRSWSARLVRAALVVILDVAIAGIIWALGAMAEGGFFRWVRRRGSRWVRSYRGRLTLALFTFFVIPAVGFAIWSYQRLQRDDRAVRELLVREVLTAAASASSAAPALAMSDGGAPLFLYMNGLLRSSSDSLYDMIAPAGRLLPRRVQMSIGVEGELTSTSRQTIAGSTMFWGYRAASGASGESRVLAAPARSDELVLDRRRRDLTLLVLFATAVGAIAAFWLSGIAARILARDLELSRIEVARAERVLAWGEMARQVAHEIKNPLTPIRLGVQHLRRARTDPRIDFDRVLDENVTRILAEIDRLDKIARTFSRYGSAPEDLPPPSEVDVAAILRDVVGLEKMGIGGIAWTLEGAESPVRAQARVDELREVLLNVFENSRLARARTVRVSLAREERTAKISIVDDGTGVARSDLPRVFDPHFSTRTTGSGLGLAISRRLLESWGGSIDLDSDSGNGARVMITLQRPA